MKNKLTYKQKKIGILVLFVFVLVVGYQRVVSHSVIEINRYIKNKEIKKNEGEIRQSILNIQNDIYSLDAYLGDDNFKEHLIQQEILEFITSKTEGNKIAVTAIKPVHSYSISSYSIISNSYTLKGSYNSLINLIYQVENSFVKSKLNSVRFFKKKNYKLNKQELFAELLFQNFKLIENE